MSSIDKGVEQVANQLNRNVRVVKRGNTIYGYIDGEVVFSLADRYGYINAGETQIVNEGIRAYEARQRALREAAEEQRKQMLEAERIAARDAARGAIAEKRRELQSALARRESGIRSVEASKAERDRAVTALKRTAGDLDFSAFTQRSEALAREQKGYWQQDVATCREKLAELDRLEKGVTDGLSAQEYRSLQGKCRKITLAASRPTSSEYENQQFLSDVSAVSERLAELGAVRAQFERLRACGGEVEMIATDAIAELSGCRVSSGEDVRALCDRLQDRAERAAQIMERSRIAEQADALSELHGTMEACRKIGELAVSGSYTANDFRETIVERAEEALRSFRALSEQEFTTCSRIRMEQVCERCEEILHQNCAGEKVLHEVEALLTECADYKDADEMHRHEFEEYRALVEELKSYGVMPNEIPRYHAGEYAALKQEMTAMVRYQKREYEKSQLISTDMAVKKVMVDMGYEVFSTVGDKEEYVRETLFCKKGYNGVLWQVISYANGHVQRRVIGVNKGDSETTVEYVKAVAAEMEQSNEPQEFLERFRDATGAKISVSEAVDHDSENVDEAIRENGYHYMNAEVAKLYDERTADPAATDQRAAKVAARVPAKRAIQTGGAAIGSSSGALRRAQQQAKAACHAH